MGQYHTIYNSTKNEHIQAHAFNEGVKLLEFGHGGLTMTALALLLCNSNGRGGGDLHMPDRPELAELLKSIQGRWAGDKIVIQGDYADKHDKGYLSKAKRFNSKDISLDVFKCLMIDSYLRYEFLDQKEFSFNVKTFEIARDVDAIMEGKPVLKATEHASVEPTIAYKKVKKSAKNKG